MNRLSGYCEVELGGEKRAFKFGMNAFALACEISKQSLDEFLASMGTNALSIRYLIWAGASANCRSQGIDEDFNLYNVGDWLDEISSENLAVLMDTIAKSQILGGSTKTPDAEQETVEKKVKSKS